MNSLKPTHRAQFRKRQRWGYSFRPNLSLRVGSAGDGHAGYLIETNEDGFRDSSSLASFRASSKEKWLIIGCSFIAGVGVRAADRVFDLIQLWNTDRVFYNAGLPGSGHDQQLLILEDLIARAEPDYVLFAPYTGCALRNLDAWRRSYDELHGTDHAQSKPRFEVVNGELVLAKASPVCAGLIAADNRLGSNFQGRITRYARHLNLQVGMPVHPVYDKIYTGRDPVGLELMKRIIGRILETANKHSAEVVTMPLLARWDVRRGYSPPASRFFTALSNESSIWNVDLWPLFEALPKNVRRQCFLVSDGHYSRLGHRLIADYVFRNDLLLLRQ